jgi:hypothetical protein
MKPELFVYMLTVHFLADFTLQTSNQATEKSTDLRMLSYHVLTYSAIWLLAAFVIFHSWTIGILFALITFAAHFVTDYATSRIGKKFWDTGDYHNGFVVVGFDQLLHYIQLYYTFLYFMK